MDHGNWYRELFAPSVAAGIIKPADLARYRNERVFIQHKAKYRAIRSLYWRSG